VDVLITQCGIAVNPRQPDLKKDLKGAGLPVMEIGDLWKMAEETNGVPKKLEHGERVVGKVMYRDGAIIDEIFQVR
jgi:citrate lyase subunit alpha/citrate CoA-transferase